MAKKEKEFVNLSIFLVIFLVIVGSGAFLFLNKDDVGVSVSKNASDVVLIDGEIVSYKYNNFQFSKIDNVWYTEVQPELINQPYTIAFTYGPINVEDVEIEFKPNYFAQYTKPFDKVYITFDHDIENGSYLIVAAVNLVSNMKGGWLINSSRACIKESENCIGADIVSCESHPKNAVIQMIQSDEPRAVYDENCLTIYANKRDFIRVAEKIILNWYGIM